MDLHCPSQPWPKRSASRSARSAKSALLASRRARLRFTESGSVRDQDW
jgi:hypothetical protein